MSICKKCGAEIEEDAKFCPKCGAPTEVPVYTDPGDKTSQFDPCDIARTKALSAFCYISFLFAIIALLVEPNSKFVRYHINQCLLLTVFGFLCGIVCIVPVLGWIVGGIGSIAVIVFTIMGIVRAAKGVAKDLPIIGKYTVVHYD